MFFFLSASLVGYVSPRIIIILVRRYIYIKVAPPLQLLFVLYVYYCFIYGVCFVLIYFSSPFYGASAELCFVLMAFPGYLHLQFCNLFRQILLNTFGL